MVKFLCSGCGKMNNPTFKDCISSGFWPGSPQRIGILYEQNLLKCWHFLRLLTPGTSEQKFIECLSTLSVEYSRDGVIDKKLFNEASKAYDFVHHLIDKRVKRIDKTSCRACTDHTTGKPDTLVCHVDGNFKLLKYSIENE